MKSTFKLCAYEINDWCRFSINFMECCRNFPKKSIIWKTGRILFGYYEILGFMVGFKSSKFKFIGRLT